ncbi:MAG: hypothetical protein JWO57_4375 [Pseudonocardiales bacterium]|nr:hypothetical protein [Pseudonocardiales bacterium]
MTIDLAPIPPAVARVRALPGTFYLRREVSNALGVRLDRAAIGVQERVARPAIVVFKGHMAVPVYDTANGGVVRRPPGCVAEGVDVGFGAAVSGVAARPATICRRTMSDRA